MNVPSQIEIESRVLAIAVEALRSELTPYFPESVASERANNIAQALMAGGNFDSCISDIHELLLTVFVEHDIPISKREYICEGLCYAWIASVCPTRMAFLNFPPSKGST